MMKLLLLLLSSLTFAYQQDPVTTRPLLRRSSSTPHFTPTRALQPPFPNGACGGTLYTISQQEILPSNSFLIPPRDIKVWVPPIPNNVALPVLYCHDGQNVMEDATSWTGASCRLAGGLSRLAERNLLKQIPIVVMIPSAQDDVLLMRRRHLEYGGVGQPFAEAHADFVANTIKPFIDQNFNTLPEMEHTFAMGSSLGGQASMHLLLRYSKIFGGAACLSPFFQPLTLDAASAVSFFLKDKRIYLDIGGDMGDDKVPWVQLGDHLTSVHWWNPGFFWLDTQLQQSVKAMSEALDQRCIQHRYHKQPGARHNERAWAQRIHLPLLHLFGKEQMQ